MKEQYVGDINDYRKYALLRRLQAASGLRLGVCWMLTPSGTSRDGRKLAYLQQPREERHDPELFRLLRKVADDPDTRRLQDIEESGILPGTLYFNKLVPDVLQGRKTWLSEALTELGDADLIFFDPDNGLDVRSKPKGSVGSCKYVYRDEVAATYRAGHSILIYQHFPREERGSFLSRTVAGLQAVAPPAGVWVFRTGHVAFLLLIRPEHHAALHSAAESISRFDPKFLTADAHSLGGDVT
jgi:hypothetical protein